VCAGLRERVNRQIGTSRGRVKRSTETAVSEHELGCAEQLARFFPGAAAVRVPARRTGRMSLLSELSARFLASAPCTGASGRIPKRHITQ